MLKAIYRAFHCSHCNAWTERELSGVYCTFNVTHSLTERPNTYSADASLVCVCVCEGECHKPVRVLRLFHQPSQHKDSRQLPNSKRKTLALSPSWRQRIFFYHSRKFTAIKAAMIRTTKCYGRQRCFDFLWL